MSRCRHPERRVWAFTTHSRNDNADGGELANDVEEALTRPVIQGSDRSRQDPGDRGRIRANQ